MIDELGLLVKLAHKMVDEYENSETTCIWEYSGSIDEETESLRKECELKHKRIEFLAGEVRKGLE